MTNIDIDVDKDDEDVEYGQITFVYGDENVNNNWSLMFLTLKTRKTTKVPK